jgi:hypothetical protein
MLLKKGVRVRHPTKPDWGLGQVLADSTAGSVRVFFVNAGEKEISTQYITLVPVPSGEDKHAALDNLRVPSSTGIRFRSLPESIQLFLAEFPEGFRGEGFVEQERDYKVAAHKLAIELLDEKSIRKSIKSGDFEEICRRALQVASATNLIFPNEKMALKDGLRTKAKKELFSFSLLDLLWGSEAFEIRFDRFCDALREIGAAKWTTATYFPYLIDPKTFMFLKPTVTQNAAELCAFELNYRPELNWQTYESVLAFSMYLKHELANLKPRDMIDVQSFMWCIAPKSK